MILQIVLHNKKFGSGLNKSVKLKLLVLEPRFYKLKLYSVLHKYSSKKFDYFSKIKKNFLYSITDFPKLFNEKIWNIISFLSKMTAISLECKRKIDR